MGITKADLENTVERINKATGSPAESYTMIEGSCRRNIGNYHINWAYGGCQLVRMCNIGGGITSITHGFDTKSNLYYQMRAYLNGVLDSKS